MNLLKFAIEKQRWDLAAHVIVLAAARVVNREVKLNARKSGKKEGCSKR